VNGYSFGSDDPLAALPADYLFSDADDGTQTFQVVLQTPGPVLLTAADLSGTLSGSLNLTVL
jgi:hypothetical protein